MQKNREGREVVSLRRHSRAGGLNRACQRSFDILLRPLPGRARLPVVPTPFCEFNAASAELAIVDSRAAAATMNRKGCLRLSSGARPNGRGRPFPHGLWWFQPALVVPIRAVTLGTRLEPRGRNKISEWNAKFSGLPSLLSACSPISRFPCGGPWPQPSP